MNLVWKKRKNWPTSRKWMLCGIEKKYHEPFVLESWILVGVGNSVVVCVLESGHRKLLR